MNGWRGRVIWMPFFLAKVQVWQRDERTMYTEETKGLRAVSVHVPGWIGFFSWSIFFLLYFCVSCFSPTIRRCGGCGDDKKLTGHQIADVTA
jgi:hypothetical protein